MSDVAVSGQSCWAPPGTTIYMQVVSLHEAGLDHEPGEIGEHDANGCTNTDRGECELTAAPIEVLRAINRKARLHVAGPTEEPHKKCGRRERRTGPLLRSSISDEECEQDTLKHS